MELQQSNYSVFLCDTPEIYFPKWLQQRAYSSVFVLCDEHTEANCYPHLAPYLPDHVCITVPAGESFKNIATCTAIWEALADNQADRKSLLINLGGGVIGDMGGFAAATYKRGIDFVQFPTTLLSQVDASVGGKLGVDLNAIKNLIGVFNAPAAVFICADMLRTLPQRQVRNGFAEVIKHGLIRDNAYWQKIRQVDIQPDTDWSAMIEHSVRIKSAVVEADPKEAGLRKILNFGHTIGHAVESWSLMHDDDPLLHGEAIAIGMICEAKLSAEMCGLPADHLQDIVETIMRHFEHYSLERIPVEDLLQVMLLDKKNADGNILFSLLRSIGDCTFDVRVTDDAIRSSLHFYCGL